MALTGAASKCYTCDQLFKTEIGYRRHMEKCSKQQPKYSAHELPTKARNRDEQDWVRNYFCPFGCPAEYTLAQKRGMWEHLAGHHKESLRMICLTTDECAWHLQQESSALSKFKLNTRGPARKKDETNERESEELHAMDMFEAKDPHNKNGETLTTQSTKSKMVMDEVVADSSDDEPEPSEKSSYP